MRFKQIYKKYHKLRIIRVACFKCIYYLYVMEKFRKEINLPIKDKQDLQIQAIKEGFNSMKEMIEQKTLKSLEEYKTKK